MKPTSNTIAGVFTPSNALAHGTQLLPLRAEGELAVVHKN